VALNEPDLVLWQVGTNDAIARIPIEDFSTSLRDGVRWLKDHNVDVVLVGVHYLRQMRKDAYFQSIRAAVAKEHLFRKRS
jgi:acyl-CoA thioesterase I